MNEISNLKTKMSDVLTAIRVLADTEQIDAENARGIISMLAMAVNDEINKTK